MLRHVLSLLVILHTSAAVEDTPSKSGSPTTDDAGLSQPQASSANKAENEFWQRAKSAVAGLHALEAEQKRKMSNETGTMHEAESILIAAKRAYHDRRAEAERELNTRMEAINPNTTNVRHAAEEAHKALHRVRETTRSEIKQMRKDLHSRFKEDRARAKDLWKQAREATETGRRFARSVARAMHEEGEPEKRTEHMREDASLDSERLRMEAEVSFDHSKDLTEQRWEGVREKLEGLTDHLKDAESSALMAQEDRLRRAEEAARASGDQSEQLSSLPRAPERLLPTSVLCVAMAAAILASIGIFVSRPKKAPALEVDALG